MESLILNDGHKLSLGSRKHQANSLPVKLCHQGSLPSVWWDTSPDGQFGSTWHGGSCFYICFLYILCTSEIQNALEALTPIPGKVLEHQQASQAKRKEACTGYKSRELHRHQDNRGPCLPQACMQHWASLCTSMAGMWGPLCPCASNSGSMAACKHPLLRCSPLQPWYPQMPVCDMVWSPTGHKTSPASGQGLD